MAKLSRESRLRDRKLVKEARKTARKRAAADGTSTMTQPNDDMWLEPGSRPASAGQ
jgi:hypothetical protein